MDHRTVRQTFLSFFEEKGHRRVASAPLVPAEDPTLLFTNAGMNQFKDLFLGREERDYARAASCQKCMRVSGKHNDFENVGHTPRHHTFFEMLGNFSFGDYFKAEAISYAWELLTGGYGLDPERLHASVYEEDDEAASLWAEEVSLPADRIHRLGAKDNFWSMGETGPCGPCTEVHYDWGAEAGCGLDDCPGPGHECGRFLEIWNLVFMQYDRSADGTLEDLPSPSVDTGMGMERITSLLQGVASNYDTDLFRPILARLAEVTDVPYGSDAESDVSLRICADHLRAAVFLIADSVIPSNEGRGYVLRKLLRRALQHGRRLGMRRPFLHRATDSVVETMGDVYPDLVESQELATRTLEQEERAFTRVLEKGDAEFHRMVESLREEEASEIPGEDAFRLHDTFGYPRERLGEMAREEGLDVDWSGFERAMEGQRTQSREASTLGSDEEAELREGLEGVAPTEFEGYLRPSETSIEVGPAQVLGLLDGSGHPVDRLEGSGLVVLDRTPFYAESGGQVGDRGLLRDPFSGEDVALVENATYVGPPGSRHVLHHVKTRRPLEKGTTVVPVVPSQRRWDIMRNHTATHLLHQALKDVLGPHVRQAGSVVAPTRLRFDYNHFEAPSEDELQRIEDAVNARILENHPVDWKVLPIERAREMGAQMLFGEKYGEEVRVISVGGFDEEDVSREFCGGTHCSATGEIGLFRISQERGVAAGVRRIEGVTGRGLLERLRRQDHIVRSLEEELNAPADELGDRVRSLRERARDLEREKERLQLKLATGGATAPASQPESKEIEGLRVEVRQLPEMDVGGLRDAADALRVKTGADVLGIGSSREGKAAFVVLVDRDKAPGLDAVALLRSVAGRAGGGGGGRPDMAWGGGQEAGKVGEALQGLFSDVEEALAG